MTISAQSAPVPLEDLIALNDEIAGLINAGVPLELGLRSLGGTWRSTLARTAEDLAERMSQGASLPEALAAEKGRFPTEYWAVVEAGLKAGRLPAALEYLTEFARNLRDMRQRIGLAAIYPAIVCGLAYCLFVGFILQVPRMEDLYFSFRLAVHGWLRFLRSLYDTIGYWGPGAPIALAALAGGLALVRMLPTARTGGMGGVRWLGAVAFFPGSGAIVRNFTLANFCDLFAVLVEHQVPLPDAAQLAAEATGDARFVQAANQVVGDLRRGESLATSLGRHPALPPLLKWMVGSAQGVGAIAAALRQAACIYRRRALYQAEWFKLIAPLVLVVVLGGGVLLAYALTLFLPLIDFIKDLELAS